MIRKGLQALLLLVSLGLFAEEPGECYQKQFCYLIENEGWFVSGEALCWMTNESGLDYAITKDIPVYQQLANNSNDNMVGDFHRAHFEWMPGVRAAIGYQFACDHWELSGEYTYYHTHGYNAVSRPNDNTLQTVYTVGQLNSTFQGTQFVLPVVPAKNVNAERAVSKIRLTYQTAALKLERHFLPSKNIVLGLFAAGQAAWISQHWHVRFQSQPTLFNGTIFNFETNFWRSWSFRGGGLQIGIESDWYFPHGVSLIVNGAVSALLGRHHVYSHTVPSSGTFNSLLQKFLFRDTRFVTNAQFDVGLAWSHSFCGLDFRIWAEYEANIWNYLAITYRFAGLNFDFPFYDKRRVIERDVLAIHGFVLGFGFHF